MANNPKTFAAEWALQHAGETISDIDADTRKVIQQTIHDFIITSGMTLDAVAKRLPVERERAIEIAKSEITRAYACSNRIMAREEQLRWTDVPVILEWYTNNDDLVCPVCRALNNAETTPDKPFQYTDENGVTQLVEDPPAHLGCRCWTSYRTNIAAAPQIGRFKFVRRLLGGSKAACRFWLIHKSFGQ